MASTTAGILVAGGAATDFELTFGAPKLLLFF